MEFYFWMLRHYPEAVSKEQKISMRRRLKRREDPLAHSMRDFTIRDLFTNKGRWRTVSKWEESISEFAIAKDCDWTDDDLRDLVNDEWIYVRGPYDCTGQWFTSDFHWKRTPAGVVLIHTKGLDV